MIHPTSQELYKAHLKQIEGTRGREIHRHLESCAECRQVLMDYQQLEQFFVKQPLENPSAPVLEAIRLKARQLPRERFLWAFSGWDRAVGLAVVFVMAAGVGILYRTAYRDRTTNDKTASMEQTEPVSIGGIMEARPFAPKKEEAVPADFNVGPAEPETVEEEAKAPVADLVSGEGTEMAQEKIVVHERAGMMRSSLTVVPPVTGADKLFDEAEEAYKAEKHNLAIFRYQSLWKNYPAFSRRNAVLFHWALCLEKLGRKSEALEKLNELKKINASYPGLLEATERMQ